MHKRLLLLLAGMIGMHTFAQLPSYSINRYDLPTQPLETQQVILYMDYDGFNIRNINGDTAALRTAAEVYIDIICTDYPSAATHRILNKNRLNACYQQFPFLKKSKVSEVLVYRQMDGKEKDKALNLFHGVVLQFRVAQDLELMKDDVTKLEDLLKAAGIHDEDSVAITLTDIRKKDTVDKKESLTLVKDQAMLGDVYHQLKDIPKNLRYARKADSLEVVSIKDALRRGYIDKLLARKLRRHTDSVTMIWGYNLWNADRSKETYEAALEADTAKTKINLPLPDSTIFKIFDRNHWENVAITGDVTGSMYPYTAQLLIWLKLHSLDSLSHLYTFFNDGDTTQDQNKVIGKTGGIYLEQCNNFQEVKKLVQKTMTRGGGGDAPENNVEALLQTEKNFPDISSHVLICDNWAPVKDLSLIDQVKKPVKVILCGVQNNQINLDYLNLAYKTKGSLHLMEEDLTRLAFLHEGEKFSIGKRNFEVKNGSIVDASATELQPVQL